MKVIQLLILLPMISSAYSHEKGGKIFIDCSSEIIKGVVLEDGLMQHKYQRRTHFAIPLNLISKHLAIPENTGFGGFQLPVVAVSDIAYKFKDTVSVPIKSENGILSVVDPFGTPWKVVPNTERDQQISNVKCYVPY